MLNGLVLMKYDNHRAGMMVMVKRCDNNPARRNTKATLDVLNSTQKNRFCSSFMTEQRNADRIPKTMKTILYFQYSNNDETYTYHSESRIATAVAIDY